MKTIALFSLMIGCANTSDDTGASIDETNTTAETADEETAEESEEEAPEETGEESEEDASEEVDNSVCSEDYSLCGDITIPGDFAGTTRSMAIVLYSSVPPAGPPDGIIAEVSAPDLDAGGTYPVRVLPALFNGDYYIWVNLYMEGGGEWAPVNGVDYAGYTPTPITFDGSPVSFDDISLNLASGF